MEDFSISTKWAPLFGPRYAVEFSLESTMTATFLKVKINLHYQIFSNPFFILNSLLLDSRFEGMKDNAFLKMIWNRYFAPEKKDKLIEILKGLEDISKELNIS
jgi:hypothetical protein